MNADECYICLTTFDSSDGRTVQAADFRKTLLREALSETGFLNTNTERFRD